MKKTIDIRAVRDKDIYISLGIFFLVSFVYYCFIANYTLYFQETQFLFVFSGEYFNGFMQKTGGPLEYLARFFTQFYAGRVAGALIISLLLTLPGYLLFIINRKLRPGTSVSLLLIIFPSLVLFLMQANYYHTLESNLGYLSVLAYYLFAVSSSKNYNQILIIALFPVFYFLAGAFALVFVVMYTVHLLLSKNQEHKIMYAILLLVITGASFLISWKLIFLQPVEQFVLSPLPLLENNNYKLAFALITAYIVLYPLIIKVTDRGTRFWFNTRRWSFAAAITLSAISLILLSKIYNPQTSRVIELERLVFEEKWDEAIKFHEAKPSRNLIGQYFYNVALSETGQMGDRLFSGAQDFMAGALVLPWGDAHLNRGAYFYYAIGLINEAHRWAYEEMVVYGYRPQNIEMLAKTSLINGDYRMASRYINILKKTIFYRKKAREFEKMADNPGLIASHPILGAKLKILPKSNFFIQFNEPQNNLPLILEGQADNSRAIEYYLAGLLLTKKVEIAVNNIQNMKESGYTRIPRHIEEAALMYYNSTRVFPELGGLRVSPETLTRFDQYFSTYMSGRNDPATLKDRMQEQFGDTFWYYFHFR